NTAMHHLFLGIDPTYVGQAPYAPSVRRGLRFAAREVGLRVHSHAPIFLLPLVAGFVGADTVGMVLPTRVRGMASPPAPRRPPRPWRGRRSGVGCARLTGPLTGSGSTGTCSTT